MTDAPERIWLTIDRKGKITGCPEANVMPCADVMDAYEAYIHADAIEALQAERDDLDAEVRRNKGHLREYYCTDCGVTDVTSKDDPLCVRCGSFRTILNDRKEARILRDADRIEELEAKLKDAMEEVSTYSNDPHLVKWARTTLAELKGQDDD